MWEMIYDGETPDHIDVINGKRLNRPPKATDDIWELMQRCWEQDPKKRPTFKEIQPKLEKISPEPDSN